MAIDREVIEQTIKLSKLEFTEEQAERFGNQLEEIVSFVEQLEGIDVENVQGTYQGNDLHTVLREDEAVRDTDHEALLENAKTTKDGLIQVPRLMSDEEGGA